MNRMEKLKEFLAANPSDSFVQHALALEHIKNEDDNTAQSLFENLLARDENYVGSYYHLANCMNAAAKPTRPWLLTRKACR